MSAETDLYAALSGALAVTALVSTRIYPDVVPADEPLPCVAYTRTGSDPVRTIHSAAPVAETAFIDVVCMAESRVAADQVADAVETAAAAAGFSRADRLGGFDFEKLIYTTDLSFEKFTNL